MPDLDNDLDNDLDRAEQLTACRDRLRRALAPVGDTEQHLVNWLDLSADDLERLTCMVERAVWTATVRSPA